MSDQSQSARSPLIRLLLVLLPLAAMLASFVWIASLDPLRSFNNGAPPVEALTIERTILDETGIQLLVRAGGSEAMVIAQVAVDDAYWSFTQDPAGPVARGDTVWLRMPYPWVLGEAHRVAMVTNTGTVFEHEIAVAVPTPKVSAGQLRLQALVGAIVGLLPVALGLMFYPAMRGLGQQGMNVLLALTVGLLAFLLIDMTGEALELSADAAALFQGSAMVWLAALAVMGGIAVVAQGEDGAAAGARRAAIAWSVLAACGFAASFAMLHAASAGVGAELPVTFLARLAGFAGMLAWVVSRRTPVRPALAIWPVLVLMGALDVAGMVAVTIAGGFARPEFASVTSSCFGLVTILLAWRFLDEPMTRAQWLGALVVFAGIAILSLV